MFDLPPPLMSTNGGQLSRGVMLHRVHSYRTKTHGKGGREMARSTERSREILGTSEIPGNRNSDIGLEISFAGNLTDVETRMESSYRKVRGQATIEASSCFLPLGRSLLEEGLEFYQKCLFSSSWRDFHFVPQPMWTC